jgi:hypothetical protein
MAALSAISAKSSSVASTIQGSGAPQLPQRGLPWAAAGTRFLRPQRGHATIFVAVISATPQLAARHLAAARRRRDSRS